MAAWRFTICRHPKSRWPPSEHMHQSTKIRDGRNAAEVGRRGFTGPEAGNRQITRKRDCGEPLVTLCNSLPRSQETWLDGATSEEKLNPSLVIFEVNGVTLPTSMAISHCIFRTLFLFDLLYQNKKQLSFFFLVTITPSQYPLHQQYLLPG